MLRIRIRALLLLTFIAGIHLSAQTVLPVVPKQPRVLILLDASSSMLNKWDEKNTRFQAAANLILQLMDSFYKVNKEIEFGLRVYGQQYPSQENNCYDTKQEILFSKNNADQMYLRLHSLIPLGVSPIAYSIKQAAEFDMVDELRYAYSLILLTDGGESCGGDICQVAKELLDKKIYFKPYILSMIDYAPMKEQYNCLGSFLINNTPEKVNQSIKTILNDYQPLLAKPIYTAKPLTNINTTAIDSTEIKIPHWIPDHSNDQPIIVKLPTENKPIKIKDTVFHVIAIENPTLKIEKTKTNNILINENEVQQLKPLWKNNQIPPISLPQIKISNTPIPTNALVIIKKEEDEQIAPAAVLPVLLLSNNSTRHYLPQYFPIEPIKVIPIDILKIDLPKKTEEPIIESKEVAILNNQIASKALPISTQKNQISPEKIAIKFIELPQKITDPIVENKEVIFLNNKVSIYSFNENKTILKILQPQKYAQPKMLKLVKLNQDTPIIKMVAQTPKTPSSNKAQISPQFKDNNKMKEASYNVKVEDDKETSLMIYFIDNKGKYYYTNPQMYVVDAQTGHEVKKFYRTIDENNQPDPQMLPAGNYNLLLGGKANLIMKSIKIEEHKKNKVFINVTNGSLIFVYADAPKKTVKEYTAIVERLFSNEKSTVKQKCSELLEYAPGNYAVEINTIPPMRYNIDIDFGTTSELPIPEPGFLQISNVKFIGRVALYYPIGDKYVHFTDMDINGNIENQKIKLLPSNYEIHWLKNPNAPNVTESITKVLVRSNTLTQIELK